MLGADAVSRVHCNRVVAVGVGFEIGSGKFEGLAERILAGTHCSSVTMLVGPILDRMDWLGMTCSDGAVLIPSSKYENIISITQLAYNVSFFSA